MKPIAILGSGPAGLLAAHTATLLGKPIALFSKPVKSHISGAQFIHKAVPGLSNAEPDAMITYRLEGTAEGYRDKVYSMLGGPMGPNFVSFQNLHDGMQQPAWSMPGIYDELWSVFGPDINEADIDAKWVNDHLNDFDKIICSIPVQAICWTLQPLQPGQQAPALTLTHTFTHQDIWLTDRNVFPMDDNTVWYSGSKDRSWYRSSLLFGNGGTEWSQSNAKPPMPNLLTGVKPVANNCDCFPGVVRVGRFGKWTKGVLAHHAIQDTYKALA